MQMDEGLDTGPILLRRAHADRRRRTTAGELYEPHGRTRRGAGCSQALDGLAPGRLVPRPQPRAGATYAKKIRREEARLDWRRPAAELERAVRAFDPAPGAYLRGTRAHQACSRPRRCASSGAPPGTVLDDHLAIACGEGALRPLRLAARRPRAASRPLRFPARLRRAAGHASAMPRYKLTLEYDGAGLVGWQRQKQRPLGAADRRDRGRALLRRARHRARRRPHRCRRPCAGAGGASRSAARVIRPTTVRSALNQHVRPHTVSRARRRGAWPTSFDARRSATRPGLSLSHPQPPPAAGARARPGLACRAARSTRRRWRDGARQLLGQHDFSSFRDSLCQARSPVKTLDALEVTRAGDEIRIEARARSFLHHQVRNMVGTLKLVGAGKWRAADVARALARATAAPAARPRRPRGFISCASSIPATDPTGSASPATGPRR